MRQVLKIRSFRINAQNAQLLQVLKLMLQSPAVIRNAHTCLNPCGVLIANVISTLEGPKSTFLHRYVEALEGEFAHVHVIPLSPDDTDVPDNVILLATDATWEFAGM